MEAPPPPTGTMTDRSDGVGVCLHGTNMLVHGGWSADRLWSLSLPSLEWSELATRGQIPGPRLHHGFVVWDDEHVAVMGGEPLAPKEYHTQHGTGGSHDVSLTVHLLNTKSLVWEQLPLHGDVPLNRSHFTVSNIKGNIVLFGGKPVSNHQLSNSAMARLHEEGFYDVFLLPRGSSAWQRLHVNDAAVPMLWGHAAAHYPSPTGDFLVVHGGMALRIDFNSFTDDPPAAEFSDRVFILNINSMRWAAIEQRPDALRPSPRTFHSVFIHGKQMALFGGVGFPPDKNGIAATAPGPLNDSWVWNIETGTWSQMASFALKEWPSGRLMSGVYAGQLVVANTLESIFFSHFDEGFRAWSKASCTMQNINYVRQSPIEARNTAPVRSTPLPASSSAFMLQQQRKQQHPARGTPQPSADNEQNIALLRKEVMRLQSELHSHASPSPMMIQSAESQAPVVRPVVPFTDDRRLSPQSQHSPSPPPPPPPHWHSPSPSPQPQPNFNANSPTIRPEYQGGKTEVVSQVRPAIRDIVEKTLGSNAFRQIPRNHSPRITSPNRRQEANAAVAAGDLPDSLVAFRRLRDQKRVTQKKRETKVAHLERHMKHIKDEPVPLPPAGVESLELLHRRMAPPPRNYDWKGHDEVSMLPSGRHREGSNSGRRLEFSDRDVSPPQLYNL